MGGTDAAEEIMQLPPGFDCFVVNYGTLPSEPDNALVAAIARQVGGWVEVFGWQSEVIHDAIDAASVRLGRQAAAGDGDPMTTWQEEARHSEIASYIWTGGQGESARKVAVILGSPAETWVMVQALMAHGRAT
jgi:hypothetical protein